MLALFVKIPTMYRLRKIRSFSADSKFSPDHTWTLEIERDNGVPFPVHVIWGRRHKIRKIYINLENHREYPHKPYIARNGGIESH